MGLLYPLVNPSIRLPAVMTTNIKLPSGVSSGNGGQCDRGLSVHQRDELQSGENLRALVLMKAGKHLAPTKYKLFVATVHNSESVQFLF